MSTVILVAIVLVLILAAVLLLLAGRRKSGNRAEDPLSTRQAESSQRGKSASLEEIELSQPFTDRVIKPVLHRLGQLASRRKSQAVRKASPREGGGTLLKRIEIARPSATQDRPEAAEPKDAGQVLHEGIDRIGPTVHMPSTGLLRRIWNGLRPENEAEGKEKADQERVDRQKKVLNQLMSRIIGPTRSPSNASRTASAYKPVASAAPPPVLRQVEYHPPTTEEIEAARQAQAERDKYLETLGAATAAEPGATASPPNAPIAVLDEALHPVLRAAVEAGTDAVDCTVMAPLQVAKGSSFLVQVFLHAAAQAEAVKMLAQEFDPTARRLGYQPLEMDLPRGTQLGIELILPGLQVEEPLQGVKWQGRTTSVQFGVKAPAAIPTGPVVGKAIVHRAGLPVGCIRFKLELVGARRPVSRQPMPTGLDAQRYQEAFISYCSQDRDEVLKRVQMLERFHIHIFQDILSIEPGTQWEKELLLHIDSCDLFLLFWSSAAKASPWVEREVRYALERKGGDESAPPEIVPVVIEGPPVPAPPPYLAHLQFNDRYLYYMKSEQAG